MLSSRFVLVIAAALVVIGVAEYFRPFGPAALRNPLLVIVLGLLLAARYGSQAMRRKRQQMLDDVPDHPLGLSDQ